MSHKHIITSKGRGGSQAPRRTKGAQTLGGRGTPTNVFANFANCMKLRKFWAVGGDLNPQM